MYRNNDIIKITLYIFKCSTNLKVYAVTNVILLAGKNHKCLRKKGRIVLTPEQNNTVMAYANTVAKHTELDLKFILNKVYEAIQIFCEHHLVPCFASYTDVDVTVKFQIIEGITEILYDHLSAFVNETILDYALTQALYTISSLYLN